MNRLSRKIMTLFAPAAATLLLFAAVASAHVTVAPAQSSTGAWETYTLKVPSEKMWRLYKSIYESGGCRVQAI